MTESTNLTVNAALVSEDPSPDAIIAMVIALAARNSVEDLHTSGAFADAQAPALNRRLRGRICEVLIALRRSHDSPDCDRFIDNIAIGNGGRGVRAVRGAVAEAIGEFSAAEAIDAETTDKLRRAATKGATDAYRTLNSLALGRSKDADHDRFALNFWLSSIPPYWEPPEIRPEVEALVTRSEGADG
jgi:hypothetical protein